MNIFVVGNTSVNLDNVNSFTIDGSEIIFHFLQGYNTGITFPSEGEAHDSYINLLKELRNISSNHIYWS